MRRIGHEREFFDHLAGLVDEAATQRVEFLVLPEFIDLEMLSFRADLQGRDQADWLAGFHDELRSEAMRLADSHQMTIVAGSGFARQGENLVNRSFVAAPGGRSSHQDKMVMTQFEIDDWGVSVGESLQSMPDPRIGVSVCYDCEFPSGVRAQAERGVLALAVPAYTETLHGFHRVRRCSEARAIENQIYVLHASLSGSLGREPLMNAVGSAAVLAPCIAPFPADGILAETPHDQESIAAAELDFDVLLKSRTEGDVRNWADRNAGNWTYGSQT